MNVAIFIYYIKREKKRKKLMFYAKDLFPDIVFGRNNGCLAAYYFKQR